MTAVTQASLSRRVVAEFVATALLLATVAGSGIMGERLAGGNVAIALLANALATGAALVALLLAFGPLSGAHMNPAVTLADAAVGGTRWGDVPAYIASQVTGAFLGVAVAHGMFGEPVFVASHHARAGGAQFLSEFVATFGLLSVIWGAARTRATAVPIAVAAYITSAYWFTRLRRSPTPPLRWPARPPIPSRASGPSMRLPSSSLSFWGRRQRRCCSAGWCRPCPRLRPRSSSLTKPSRSRHERRSHEAPDGGAPMKTVIFACVHNAGRSQMAAAFFNGMADPRKARAISAGTHPGERVHPEVESVMRELGIDLANSRPRKLTADLAEGVYALVTMGCGDECPMVPGAKREDWPLPDPKDRPLEEVRRIRDEIRDRVSKMLAAERWTKTA